MSQRKPYPSDLSDARWALIEPTLSAWRKARLDRRPTGQPAQVELRDVFNALLYVNRTGIPWKYLPHDFPNHGTVYAYCAAWRDEGILAQLNYDLTGLARVKEGRKPEPTASVIDTQSVKTSTNVPLASQGADAAKKIVGRKRGIITDTRSPLQAPPDAAQRAASPHPAAGRARPCSCARTRTAAGRATPTTTRLGTSCTCTGRASRSSRLPGGQSSDARSASSSLPRGKQESPGFSRESTSIG